MSFRRTAEIEMRVLASRLRREMGWSDVDAVNVFDIIKKKNILTVFKSLNDDNVSGMAVKNVPEKGDARLFMLINTSQSIGKQRFTACHELYHLLIQQDFQYSFNNAGKFDEANIEEYKADVFAANLLIPISGIEDMVPIAQMRCNSIKLDTVLNIEQHFRCSRATLLRCLKSMKYIDSEKYDELRLNVTKGAAEYGYDLSLYKANRLNLVVGDYNIKARTLLESGKISVAKYNELIADLKLDNVSDGEE